MYDWSAPPLLLLKNHQNKRKMKLTSNFYELLQKDELPKRYCDWWILEENDFYFENHTKLRMYSPFNYIGSERKDLYFHGREMVEFLNEARKVLGCFRKKNSKQEIHEQNILQNQFDYHLIYATYRLEGNLRDRHYAQKGIDEMKDLYKKGMTGMELVNAEQLRDSNLQG